MRISQHVWTRNAGWVQVGDDVAPPPPLFSAPDVWRISGFPSPRRRSFPDGAA